MASNDDGKWRESERKHQAHCLLTFWFCFIFGSVALVSSVSKPFSNTLRTTLKFSTNNNSDWKNRKNGDQGRKLSCRKRWGGENQSNERERLFRLFYSFHNRRVANIDSLDFQSTTVVPWNELFIIFRRVDAGKHISLSNFLCVLTNNHNRIRQA